MGITLLLTLAACGVGSATDNPANDKAASDSAAETGILVEDSAPDSGSDDSAPPHTGDTAPATDLDEDGFDAPEDCNDLDDDVHPGAEDWCDGVDQDCDGDPQGDGSCGDPEDVTNMTPYWWWGELGEMLTATWPYDLDGTPVLTGYVAGCSECEQTSSVVGMVLLSGLPGPEHGWFEDATALWLARDRTTMTGIGHVVGDFDGDGYDDFAFGSYSSYDDAYDEISIQYGPSSNWPHGEAYWDDTRDAGWVARELDDSMSSNVWPAGDINGDGYADIVAYGGVGPGTGTLAAILGRTGAATVGNAVTDDVWLDWNNVGSNIEAVVGDLDGDGYRDVVVGLSDTVMTVGGSDLISCQGCLVSDVWQLAVDSDPDYSFTGSNRGLEGDDITGDGVPELVIWANDYYGTTEAGSCALWVDGAAIGAGIVATVEGSTRVCTGGFNSGSASPLSDGDGDGLGDAQVEFATYEDGVGTLKECFVPGWSLVPYVSVDIHDASWCPDDLSGMVGDLDGDNRPEFVGSTGMGVGYRGGTWILPGFDIPWDDESKW